MAIAKQCERCGAENPDANNFCGNCGAALPASSAPPTDAAPPPVVSADTTTDDGTSGAEVTAGDAQGTEQRPAARPAADDLPDWLRDLNAWGEEQPQPLPLPSASASSEPDAPTEVVAATQHELPAWLRADMAELEAAPATDDSPADVPTLPAWLANDPDADARARPAPSAEAASETPTVAGLPSWLVATPSAAPPTANREPSETQPPAEPPVSTMPRWLLDDDEDDVLPPQTASMATVSADEQPTEPVLPSWLRDPQPTPLDDDAAPSWEQAEALKEDGADAAPVAEGDEGARIYDQAPRVPVPAPVAPSTEPGLPDWLLDTTPASAQNDQTVPPQGANWLAGTPTERADPALPSWLYGQETPPVTAAPAAADATPADSTPGWLLHTPTEAVTPSPAAAASDQPDWLQVLGQTGDEQAAQPDSADQSGDARATPVAAQAAPDEPRLPDWLRPTPEEEAAAAVQARPAEPEDDVPEWLRDFTTSQPPLVVEQAEPRPVDQWLTDTGPEPPSFAALPIAASNESRARIYDVRDTDTEIEAATPREPSSPLPGWLVGQNADTGEEPWALPPWLSEADNPSNQPATRPTPVSTTASGELPAWLQDDGTTPAPATSAPPIVSSSIPDWLQAQDTTPSPQRAPDTASAPAAIPATPVPDASTVMERVVAEPAPEPVAVAPAPAPRRSSWLPATLALVAFALVVAVILYVLLGFGSIPFLGSVGSPPIASAALLAPNAQPQTAAVARWREHLAQLAPDAPVLVAYATDGSRAAELAPLEAGLLGELRERGTPLALLATDPQGALLSRRAAERAQSPSSASPVIDLGYQPGGALALARLARDSGRIFERDAAGRPLRADPVVASTFCGGATTSCSLGGFGMTIVLADQSDDARVWVEQVGSVYPDMSLVFAVPAENAPAVQPYITSPRTMMLAGLTDAVALTPDAVQFGAPLSRHGDAVALGGAAWGILALVGAIPALVGGWSRRRRGQGDPWQR